MNIIAVKMPFMPYSPYACVYRINFGLGKFYIGSTTNLEDRIDAHIGNIKRGSRPIGEYVGIINGKYMISFTILEEIKDLSQLTIMEQFYLDKNFDNPNCMNSQKCSTNNKKVKKMLEEVS